MNRVRALIRVLGEPVQVPTWLLVLGAIICVEDLIRFIP